MKCFTVFDKSDYTVVDWAFTLGCLSKDSGETYRFWDFSPSLSPRLYQDPPPRFLDFYPNLSPKDLFKNLRPLFIDFWLTAWLHCFFFFTPIFNVIAFFRHNHATFHDPKWKSEVSILINILLLLDFTEAFIAVE